MALVRNNVPVTKKPTPIQDEKALARIAQQVEIRRLQAELAREKAELVRINQKLVAAQQQNVAMFSALTEVLPGLVLDGKYRLEEKIGSGGFGVVYRATQLGLARAVAVKVFRPPEQAGQFDALWRFQREGVSACRVKHPNAVTVLDAGTSPQGVAYLVMELLDGPTLYTEMAQQQLSFARCLQIILPLCEVLIAAHAAGIVHRDIKPENILLHHPPGGEVVKVLDFGIAKLLRDEPHQGAQVVTGRNELVGTPTYMAPERLNGSEYDGRSDVYSTGILFYEMLAGQVPFQDREQGYFRVAFNHLHGRPTPLRTYRPDLSERLAELVLWALTRDPAQRPTAQQFRDALMELMKVESLAARMTRPEATTRAAFLDGSRSTMVPGVLSQKAVAELLQEWNAGESDPFIEIVISPSAY